MRQFRQRVQVLLSDGGGNDPKTQLAQFQNEGAEDHSSQRTIEPHGVTGSLRMKRP